MISGQLKISCEFFFNLSLNANETITLLGDLQFLMRFYELKKQEEHTFDEVCFKVQKLRLEYFLP